MKHSVSVLSWRQHWRWVALFPAAVVVAWAAGNFALRPLALAHAAGVLLYAGLLALSVRRPLLFVVSFLVVVAMLPPFYFSSMKDIPIYVPALLLPIALAVLALRLGWLRFQWDPIAKGLAIFLVGTGLSVPFAYVLSGDTVGMQSLFRWLMLAQVGLIYALIRGTDAAGSGVPVIPVLMVAAVLSAGYGLLDFVWPVPLPHPAAQQFIWLESSVLRRAQGVFYESSSFANFCGFFLVICAAALLTVEEQAVRLRRSWLLIFVTVLGSAVLLAFSRSEWGCVLLSLMVFAALSGHIKARRVLLILAPLAAPLMALRWYVPEMWNYLVTGRVGVLLQILAHPNVAATGRLTVWAKVVSIIQNNPAYLLFGIGYKSLPLTRLFHGRIITDNGYLSLLVETGILGLGGFVVFSTSIFKTFLALARTRKGVVAFWSAVLFSFWCGECLQMLTADAYTYWRNLIMFTAFMALTLNMSEREWFAVSSRAAGCEKPLI